MKYLRLQKIDKITFSTPNAQYLCVCSILIVLQYCALTELLQAFSEKFHEPIA